ncbi:MAG TPA: hypothetical protein VH592_10810 [Gemmataceae bacterium]|jgi:hypothetical protein
MKSYRALVLLAVVLIALAGVRYWQWKPTAVGAATPEECVENYYESLKSGDVDRYLRCLGEPYRSEAGQRFFDAACRDAKDVKGVVQRAGSDESGSTLWMDVEEVRAAGIRRLRYHLRQDDRVWVIVSIDPPRETTSPVRYGTPVGDEP